MGSKPKLVVSNELRTVLMTLGKGRKGKADTKVVLEFGHTPEDTGECIVDVIHISLDTEGQVVSIMVEAAVPLDQLEEEEKKGVRQRASLSPVQICGEPCR